MGGSLYFIQLILMFKLYVMFVAIFYSDNVCIYDLKAFFNLDYRHVTVSVCHCLFVCVCVGPMSRVQAIRDYHGRDCRFLSFQRGDTIFVYHKLTGKREDLWAGSVCYEFHYFLHFTAEVNRVIHHIQIANHLWLQVEGISLAYGTVFKVNTDWQINTLFINLIMISYLNKIV